METSSATPHPATLPIDELLKECEVRRTRRRGPGGQHRNKVETAIEIRHEPTNTRAEASERRSQEQNRKVAIQRLRVQLAIGVRAKPSDEPSELWRRRRQGKRIAVATEHEDFAPILAEALDAATAFESEQQAADQLGISASQLIKLLKREPQAILLLNERRRERGQHALK